MADLDAGATGTMPSAMLPDLIGPVAKSYLAGSRAEAAVRPPLTPLHPATRSTLLEMVRELNPVALNWGRQA